MKNMSIIGLVLIFFTVLLTVKNVFADITSEGSANETCEEHEALLTSALQDADTLQGLTASIVKEHPSIILIGEQHGVTEKYYAQIIRELKLRSPEFDCLFLELPIVDSESFAKSLKTLSAYDKLTPWLNSARLADKLGIKINLIDLPIVSFDYSTSSEGMNLRDELMAGAIIKSVQAGECKQGLSLGGRAHLTAMSPGRSTLNMRLRETLKKVITVNMVSSGKITNPFTKALENDISWIWNDTCNSIHLKKPKQIVTFKVNSALNQTSLSSTGGSWSDFDYAIISP
ncbi:MAG: hypothetical protein ACXWRE_07540 [Pseudobdellovibrionaceae bacterium]